MNETTEVLRLLLAAVFAVAAVAKLADREGSRRTVRDFGGPAWLAIGLPVAELAIAAALVPAAMAHVAALAAAGLLLVFAAAVANARVRGRQPGCGCLGRLYSKPAGWGTVARNVLLAGGALMIASQPSAAPTRVDLAVAGIVVLVAAQAILILTLFRRYGRALERIETLETARPAERLHRAAPAEAETGSPTGARRLTLTGAAASALAVTTAAAQAAPPTHPELIAIDNALRAAEPRLVAASGRSLKAIRKVLKSGDGKGLRASQTAARNALAAERREVLALRARIDKLPATGSVAHNVKVMTLNSLSLLALSLAKRRQAVRARPKSATPLVKEAQKLFLRSLGSSAAAGKLLGRGS